MKLRTNSGISAIFRIFLAFCSKSRHICHFLTISVKFRQNFFFFSFLFFARTFARVTPEKTKTAWPKRRHPKTRHSRYLMRLSLVKACSKPTLQLPSERPPAYSGKVNRRKFIRRSQKGRDATPLAPCLLPRAAPRKSVKRTKNDNENQLKKSIPAQFHQIFAEKSQNPFKNANESMK